MAKLLAAVEASRAGAGAVVVVGGEPGIGKSRLAEELAACAREHGVRVFVGRCREAGGAPPYWPCVQVLRACTREVEPVALAAHVADRAAELGTIVPELAEALGVQAAAIGAQARATR